LGSDKWAEGLSDKSQLDFKHYKLGENDPTKVNWILFLYLLNQVLGLYAFTPNYSAFQRLTRNVWEGSYGPYYESRVSLPPMFSYLALARKSPSGNSE